MEDFMTPDTAPQETFTVKRRIDDSGQLLRTPPSIEIRFEFPKSAQVGRDFVDFLSSAVREGAPSLIYLLTKEAEVRLSVNTAEDGTSECSLTLDDTPLDQVEDPVIQSVLEDMKKQVLNVAEFIRIRRALSGFSMELTIPPRAPADLLKDLSAERFSDNPYKTTLSADKVPAAVFRSLLSVNALPELTVDAGKYQGAIVYLGTLVERTGEEAGWRMREGAVEFLRKLESAFGAGNVKICSGTSEDSKELLAFAFDEPVFRDFMPPVQYADMYRSIAFASLAADAEMVMPDKAVFPLNTIHLSEEGPDLRQKEHWLELAERSEHNSSWTFVHSLDTVQFV